ncbi:MAG: hypothetical protein IJW33_06450 [Lentisphaeria bacterium]|nr:hypothetical protein [Lentisphaeria bacterium]
MKRYNFNLVEIMLAVVILTVGMTSVFVLFPAGLSNHRSAVAENSISDMAELVISRIRAEAALASDEEGFLDADTNNMGEYNDSHKSEDADKIEALDWMEFDKDDPWTVKKIENGFYLVRQLSGSGEDKYIDFAAVVQVYKDANYEDELFVTMKSGDAVLYSSLDKSKHDSFNVKELKSEEFVLPLIVEISYPADRPYDDREKAYFRFEIYNDNYKLTE